MPDRAREARIGAGKVPDRCQRSAHNCRISAGKIRINALEVRKVQGEDTVKFLNFGSLNIDHVYAVDHFVQAGETLAAADLQMFCGGKGLNQSIALKRSGLEVYHAGAVGKDGRMLLDILEENGISTEFISIKDCPTGHAIIQNDKNGQNCIMLYGGANQALSREDVDRVLDRFEADDYVLMQNEINEMTYIMNRAHEKGMKIILNPSPADAKIFEYPIEFVDYLILNEIEIRQLYEGITGENSAYIEKEKDLAGILLQRFPGMKIIMTLGSQGSVYIDQDRMMQQQAYRVKAVDTTAAGDTFTGYLFGGLISGQPIDLAMDMASRASAMAVMKKGAAPSIPWRSEVEKFESISQEQTK